jgi:outer membrane immunogenic protein
MFMAALVVAGPAFATDDNATAKPSSSPSTDASAPTPAPAAKAKSHSSPDPDRMWSGFSLGINFGYSQSNGDTSFNPLPNEASFFNLEPQTLVVHPHGIIGGVDAGYDMQHGAWVFGLAADFSGTGITTTTRDNTIIQSDGSTFSGGFLSARETVDWLSTIRGRAGFTVDKRVLFYATGGVAIGGFNFRAETNFQPTGTADYVSDINRIKVGWVAGGGIEYHVHHRWSAGVEYLYYDFPNEANAVPSVPANGSFEVGYTWGAKGQIIRAILNYKF